MRLNKQLMKEIASLNSEAKTYITNYVHKLKTTAYNFLLAD